MSEQDGSAVASESLGATMMAICAEVLGCDGPRLEDDIFDLGADSLSAMHLVARIRQVTGARVSIKELFAAPKLADIATVVEERITDEGSSAASRGGLRGAAADLRRSQDGA